MNFYKNAALALDHLDKHQGSVKGSLNAAGINCTPGESKRLLACKLNRVHSRRKELMR
jgi:putative methyltransferase